METEHWNPWGDGPLDDDELPLYERWQESLHDFKEGPNGRCTETIYISRGRTRICGGYSHGTNHLPLPCCHCKHGVYLHTSYDIPCGKCEMESDIDYEMGGY